MVFNLPNDILNIIGEYSDCKIIPKVYKDIKKNKILEIKSIKYRCFSCENYKNYRQLYFIDNKLKDKYSNYIIPFCKNDECKYKVDTFEYIRQVCLINFDIDEEKIKRYKKEIIELENKSKYFRDKRHYGLYTTNSRIINKIKYLKKNFKQHRNYYVDLFGLTIYYKYIMKKIKKNYDIEEVLDEQIGNLKEEIQKLKDSFNYSVIFGKMVKDILKYEENIFDLEKCDVCDKYFNATSLHYIDNLRVYKCCDCYEICGETL